MENNSAYILKNFDKCLNHPQTSPSTMKSRLFPNKLSKKKKSNNLAPMRLHAYVFCDCLEQGRLKRQPPNPEIVGVIANGDLGYYRATREQHAAFVAWRSHACRHPEGVVTGGQLGHRLPRQVLHRAMSPHSRAFPLFIRKVLGCKPHTRYSHLTLKQVEKLQVELARLKNFHLAARKLDRELRCFYGQMRHLVRAALKFHKPIAM